MGEHALGSVTEREIRMATGFAAGIGYSYQENCGAFSAGVMIISGLFGRVSPDENDSLCQAATTSYRERFLDRFGTLTCGELREEKYGSGGKEPCSVLVERASRILLDAIDEAQQKGGN